MTDRLKEIRERVDRSRRHGPLTPDSDEGRLAYVLDRLDRSEAVYRAAKAWCQADSPSEEEAAALEQMLEAIESYEEWREGQG